MRNSRGFQVIAALLVYSQLVWPTLVAAQSSRGGKSAGIVTTLSGEATVQRADRPAQTLPLKFKDELYSKDRISTKQNSIARVLMGGRSLVTVREQSELTITEEPGKASFLDLFSGKIALAVAKLRMRPGETIEVRTPNAVAAVRGTVLVVEVTPASPNGEAKPRKTAFTPGARPVAEPGFNTTFHVTQGRVDVFDLGGVLRQSIPAGQTLDIIGGAFRQPRPNPPNVFAGLKAGAQHTGTPEEATEGLANKQAGQAEALAEVIAPPPPPPVNVINPCSANPAACATPPPLVTGEPIVTFTGFGPNTLLLEAPLAVVLFDPTTGAAPQSPTPLAFSAASLGTSEAFIIPFNPFDPEQTPGQVFTGEGTAIRTPYFATSTGFVDSGENFVDVPVTLPGGIGLDATHVDGLGGAFTDTVFLVDGAVANLTGSALRLTNGSRIDNIPHVIQIGSTLNQTLGAPLLDIQNSSVFATDDIVNVNDGVLTTAGSVVSISGLTPDGESSFISAGDELLQLNDSRGVVGSVLIMSQGAQGFVDSDVIDLESSSLMVNGNAIQVTDSFLLVNGDVVEVSDLGPDGKGLTVTGTVLSASGAPPADAETIFTIEVDSDVLDLSNTQAMIGSALTITNGAKVKLGGQVFDIFSSTVTVNGTAVQITNGALEADALAYVGGINSSLTINGGLLSVTNGMVTLVETVETDGLFDQLILNLGANQPVIGLTNSTLTLTGEGNLVAFENFTGATRNQTGVALIANQSTINLENGSRLFRLLDSVFDSLHLTDTNYQIQLSNSVVNLVGSSSVITVEGNGLVTSNGGLLNATGALIRSETVSHEETSSAGTSGCCPISIAMSPNGRRAYVANGGDFGDRTVDVFDTLSKTRIATVDYGEAPVGNGFPVGVAVTPDGSRVFVAHGGGEGCNDPCSTVSIINTATNTVVGTVNVGTGPRNIAFTPNGAFAYVTNQFSDNVSVINTGTNSVVATIPVGNQPFGVTVSPDGARAYVANQSDNSVSVINTATNSVIAVIPVGSRPFHVGITPDGAQVYVANKNSNTVSVINTATNTVVATVPVGSNPRGIAVSPDGGRVYVTNRNSGSVSIINTRTNTVIDTVFVEGGESSPNGVAVAADGTQRAFVVNEFGNSVSVLGLSINNTLLEVFTGTDFMHNGTAPVFLFDSSLVTIGEGVHTNGRMDLGTAELIRANNSILTIPEEIVHVEHPGRIAASGPGNVVTIIGGVHGLSFEDTQAVFTLEGCCATAGVEAIRSRTVDDGDGGALVLPAVNRTVGSTKPLHGGTIAAPAPLQRTLLGATDTDIVTNQLVKLDPALLDTVAAFLNLTTGTLGSFNSLVTIGPQSHVLANLVSPTTGLANLNNSTLTVVNGPAFSVTGGSFFHLPTGSLFSANNTSLFDIRNGSLLTVAGNSVFRIDTGHLGAFGPTGTNVLNLANAPACGLGCVSLLSTGFNILLLNGATAANNLVINPAFVPFQDLGGSNSVTVGNNGPGDTRALLVVDGVGSFLQLGPVVDFVPPPPCAGGNHPCGEVNFGTPNLTAPIGRIVLGPADSVPPLASVLNPIGNLGTVLTIVADANGVSFPGGVRFNNVTATADPGVNLFEITGVNATLTGASLLELLGTTVTLSGGGSGLKVASSLTSTSPDALISLVPSLAANNNRTANLTANHLLLVQNGGMVEVNGSGLEIVPNFFPGSSVNLSGSVTHLEGGSTFKTNSTTGAAAIKIGEGSLTADALASSDGGPVTPNTFNLTGTILDLNQATVMLNRMKRVPDGVNDNDTFSLVLGPNEAAINMVNSTLTLNDVGEELVFFGVTDTPGGLGIQNGVALKAVGDGGTTINVKGPVLTLEAFSGNLTLTDVNPQIQLTNETVNQTGITAGMIEVNGHAVEIRGNIAGQGQLVHANFTDINLSGDLVQIIPVFSTDLQIQSSLHVKNQANMAPLATLINNSSLNARIVFNLRGDFIGDLPPNFEPLHGVDGAGARTALQNTLLATSGTGPNTILADTFVQVDRALLEATKPFIDAVNAAMTFNSDFAKFVNGATFNTPGVLPSDALTMVGLNASSLTINNGHLVNVVGPGTFSFIGSLFTLLNNSTLTINNGTAASISGGGIFNLTGSLGVFGAGVNTFNVTNTLCASAACTNIPTGLAGLPNIRVLGTVNVGPGFTPFTGTGLSNAVFNIAANAAVINATGGTANLIAPPAP